MYFLTVLKVVWTIQFKKAKLTIIYNTQTKNTGNVMVWRIFTAKKKKKETSNG